MSGAKYPGLEELDGAERDVSTAIVELQHALAIGCSCDEDLAAVTEPLRDALSLIRIAKGLAFPDAAKGA